MSHAFKALRHGRRGTHTDFEWPEPGTWIEVPGDLVACRNGLHACRLDQIPTWLNDTLWLVEIDDDAGLIDAGSKLIARRMRLRRFLPWNERTARLWAADCAERVLPLFEAARPGDMRPREAIEAARDHAWGLIDDSKLDDAAAAARATVKAAAWANGGAAAARATVQAAAREITWVAGFAAQDAQYAAGEAGAGDASDAERRWQLRRLAAYLALRAPDGGRS